MSDFKSPWEYDTDLRAIFDARALITEIEGGER